MSISIYVKDEICFRKAFVLNKDLELIDFYVEDKDETSMIGTIIVGKVVDINKVIGHVFVSLSKNGSKIAILKNKKNISNFCVGQKLIVQVVKDASSEKDIAVSNLLCIENSSFICKEIFENQKTREENNINFSYKNLSTDIRKKTKEIINELQGNKEFAGFNKKYSLIFKENIKNNCKEDAKKEIVKAINTLYELRKENLENKQTGDLINESVSFVDRIINDYGEKNDFYTNCYDIYSLIKNKVKKFEGSKLFLNNISKSRGLIFTNEFVNSLEDMVVSKTSNIKGGGKITVDKTEAMIVFDIDSGGGVSYKGVKGLEELNKNAVREIIKEIAIKNISGIILIDFVSIYKKGWKNNILDFVKNELRKNVHNFDFDVLNISYSGIMEITKKRRYVSVYDVIFQKSNCNCLSVKNIASNILTEIKNENKLVGKVSVYCQDEVLFFIENNLDKCLKNLEKSIGKKVNFCRSDKNEIVIEKA